MSLARTLAPFSSRNYRLYFGGQLVSLTGSWITQTATIWLVFELTRSPAWLGTVTLLGQLPVILLAPVGGVWADRLNRLTLLKVTQALAMAQSLLLAFFTFTGRIDIPLIVALSMFQGVINAFDVPTRQSLNVLLAEKREHLPAIVAMNSSMFHAARLAGPALAGFLIAALGVEWCFLLDGLSYLAVLGAIFAMRLKPPELRPSGRSVWHEIQEGARYAFGHAPIRALILLTGAIGALGLSYPVLLPFYSAQVFGGDALTLGWLMSATAAGSVLAALYLAGRSSIRGLGRTIVLGGLLAAAGLVTFALSSHLAVSLAALVLVGTGGILVLASNNTLVQNLVEESKRGRVMSIYAMALLGGIPLGGFLTGWLAAAAGLMAATLVNAACCVGLVLIFALRLPALRAAAGSGAGAHPANPRR